MGAPFYIPPSTGRRVRADGLIDVICRICEKTITSVSYDRNRFSTAICAVCQGAIDKGQDPVEVAERRRLEELQKAAEIQNEIGPSGFMARGLRRRVKEIVDAVKTRVTARRRNITSEP